MKKLLPTLAGPVLFALVRSLLHPTDLSPAGVAVLAITLWMAIWWIFEVVDIAVTALLPVVLFPLTDVLSISETTASYGHRYIFLYLGGFLLAVAIEKWQLHRRIALTIIRTLGTGIARLILGFMLATAFLSMWISNTATAVMMLPIAMAVLSQIADSPDLTPADHSSISKALMLSIAYSASIGGMGTLIGTPPNLVLAGIVEELYGTEISFGQWIKFGLPISVLLLAICWAYLTRVAFRFELRQLPGGRAEILRRLRELGPYSREELTVLVVFVLTAALWIGRSYLQQFIPALDDTIIAMVAGIALFLLPTGRPGEPILRWSEAVRIPWGIILLFGGGMALAAGFRATGLAEWIGQQFTSLDRLPVIVLVAILIASVNFLTEITSNLATTAVLLPILAPMAVSLNLHPYVLLVAATVAASCAFMLPVATPPNAVVFGSGHLNISDMVRTGIWMNLISIVLLTGFVYFVLPLVWGFVLR